MVVGDVRETIRCILPVLVDNTKKAHHTSARLYHRFGVVSLIFGKPRLWDLIDPSSQTLRLPHSDCERLRVEELIDLAKKSEDYLPVLIPCSDEARAFVARHRTSLEAHFILSDAETLLSDSPFVRTEDALRIQTHAK